MDPNFDSKGIFASPVKSYISGVKACPFTTGLICTIFVALPVLPLLSVILALIVTEVLPAGTNSEPPTTQLNVLRINPDGSISLPAILNTGARLSPATMMLPLGCNKGTSKVTYNPGTK